MNDKRKNIRLTVDIPVKIRFNGMTIPAMARNLSSGGIYIQSQGKPHPTTQKSCELIIQLPDGRGPMQVESKVVWQRPDIEELEKSEQEGEEVELQSGVKFDQLDTEQKARLNEFITRNIRENLN